MHTVLWRPNELLYSYTIVVHVQALGTRVLGVRVYDTTASLDTNGWLFYRLIMQGNIRREAKEKY